MYAVSLEEMEQWVNELQVWQTVSVETSDANPVGTTTDLLASNKLPS